MKTPIEPGEIRKGDLIRAEWDADEAREYRAEWDGQRYNKTAAHYLLDRPRPPVVLPTEPTLGWATNGNLLAAEFGTWRLDDDGTRLRFVGASWGWRADAITAFVPATAVPTEALDALRTVTDQDPECGLAAWEWEIAVAAFLTAVDNANGAKP